MKNPEKSTETKQKLIRESKGHRGYSEKVKLKCKCSPRKKEIIGQNFPQIDRKQITNLRNLLNFK